MPGQAQPGEVLDEARQAGRQSASFTHATEDYFHDMDGAVALSPQEVAGRNMWLVWSGGNDRLWNRMTDYTFGAFDLLKIISSHPSQGYSRANRWHYFGLVKEPCFENAAGPDKGHCGLWLDARGKGCAADPFENESKYPGAALGSRGKPLGDGTPKDSGRTAASSGQRQLCALTAGGIGQAGLDVFGRQVREVGRQLWQRHTGGEALEHVVDRHSQPANARFAAAFSGLDRDDVAIVFAGCSRSCRRAQDRPVPMRQDKGIQC